MVSVNIDFAKADTITNEINNTTSDMSTISSSAKGISADAFASYSPGTVGLNESFISGLSKVVPSCDNFLSKFKGYIQTYYDAYQEQLHAVEEEIKEEPKEEVVEEPETVFEEAKEEVVVEEPVEEINEDHKEEVVEEAKDEVFEAPKEEVAVEPQEQIVEAPKEAEHSEFYTENAIASAGNVTFTISEEKADEIAQTNKFYYQYPGNVSEVKEIKGEKLVSLFETNGAQKATGGTYPDGHTVTRGTNDGWYKFDKDGHTYEYNVNTNEIIVDYTLPCYTFKGGKDTSATFNCKFFATDDTDFNAIKNTIAVCGGQGILDHNEPVYSNDIGRTLLTGLNANKNSMIIVPYGKGYGTVASNIAPGVIASTQIGNFLSGGNNKEVTNNIIGFSLGGQAAFHATSITDGLYKKAAIFNATMVKYTKPSEGMKKVEYYIFQASGDATFGKGAPSNLKKLILKCGVPKENVTVFTNDSGMLSVGKKVLDEDHLINLRGTEVAKSGMWGTHVRGIEILKASGITNYFSE